MLFTSIRHRLIDSILIERPTVAAGFGQVTTWDTVETVSGYIWSLSGSESIDYGGDNVRSTHRMITDIIGIDESCRCTANGRTYLVRFVDTKKIDGDEWLQVDLEYVGAAA